MVVHNSQFELKTLKVSENTKQAIRQVVFTSPAIIYRLRPNLCQCNSFRFYLVYLQSVEKLLGELGSPTEGVRLVIAEGS
jgi:hypothetical protein